MMLLGRLRVSTRLLLVLTVGLAVQGALSVTALLDMRRSMHAGRAAEVQHLVEAAYSAVKGFQERVAKGQISEAAAQEAAKATLRAMRYDGGNYFFVWSRVGTSIAHGANPALEGRTFLDSEDATKAPGVAYMVRQLVGAVKDGDSGVARYPFPKPGQTEPLDKVGYAKLFAPWGWIIGTGAYTDDIEAAFWAQARSQLVMAFALIGVAGLISVMLGRDLSRALQRLSGRVERVVAGELDGPVPGTERRDEVGTLARALHVLRDTSRDARTLRASQSAQEAEIVAEAERRRAIAALADSFESTVRSVVSRVTTGTQHMRGNAAAMSDAVSQSDREAQVVAAELANTQAESDAMVGAADRLARTVKEIADQMVQSAQTADQAATQAASAATQIGELEQDSQKIGAVLALIGEIASQTNLLALNATIEAARAGEAGAGFAVVAGEVKKLASQTTRATTDIATQIDRIQQATRGAVQSINGIAGAIHEIDAKLGTTVSAIQSHSAATDDILRFAHVTAQGRQAAEQRMMGVARSTDVAGKSALGLLDAAEGLDRQSRELQTEVDSFVSRLRA